MQRRRYFYIHQKAEPRLEGIVVVQLRVCVLACHHHHGQLHHHVVIHGGRLGHGVDVVAAVDKLAVGEPSRGQVPANIQCRRILL